LNEFCGLADSITCLNHERPDTYIPLAVPLNDSRTPILDGTSNHIVWILANFSPLLLINGSSCDILYVIWTVDVHKHRFTEPQSTSCTFIAVPRNQADLTSMSGSGLMAPQLIVIDDPTTETRN
jgi:hypothetical protein